MPTTTITGATASDRLAQVQAAMAQSARIARRAVDAITLIAISKTYGPDAIQPLIDAGQRHFGENRVQEAQGKWPALITAQPDMRLHLVGQLQSNKAADAVALFDVVHSIDRPSLADALAKAMAAQNKRPDCFIQVNIGDEAQKGGCALSDLPDFVAQCHKLNLPIIGLMCVPPADLEPAPFFALLAQLADRYGLPALSMGMSSDYESAVQLGATHVRVGSALFGARSST
jgi:PLP dependent protein